MNFAIERPTPRPIRELDGNAGKPPSPQVRNRHGGFRGCPGPTASLPRWGGSTIRRLQGRFLAIRLVSGGRSGVGTCLAKAMPARTSVWMRVQVSL